MRMSKSLPASLIDLPLQYRVPGLQLSSSRESSGPMLKEARALDTASMQPPLMPDSLLWVATASRVLALYPHLSSLRFHCTCSRPWSFVSTKARTSAWASYSA